MNIAGMSDGELKATWEPWLKLSLDPDEAGWRLGWCPRHSPQHRGLCDAEVNFILKRFRCNNDQSCSGDKSGGILLRDPTAWVLGFDSYTDLRKHRLAQQRDGQVRKPDQQAKWSAAEQAIAVLRDAHPKVEPAFLPTRGVADLIPLLIKGEPPIRFKSMDGWWPGWCPIHDEKRSKNKTTAYYNFRAGSYVCLAPVPCHAPKRGLTLNNLKVRMSEEASA